MGDAIQILKTLLSIASVAMISTHTSYSDTFLQKDFFSLVSVFKFWTL